MIALTRAVPPTIVACELTHLSREPIDVMRAMAQHRRYEHALATLGCRVVRVPAAPELPDSVFVEDIAVVLPGIAIMANPGAPSRRAEIASIEQTLRAYRPLARIEAPGTLDGGDVLRIGRRLLVGRSTRTNADGIRQLREIVAPLGHAVESIGFEGCLHLKTAATPIADDTVLVNPAWVDATAFRGCTAIEVDPDEPFAANALRVGDSVIHPATCPLTRRRLEMRGIAVVTVDIDELARAEAGVTCCCILLD
jgi:dimethylargininase